MFVNDIAKVDERREFVGFRIVLPLFARLHAIKANRFRHALSPPARLLVSEVCLENLANLIMQDALSVNDKLVKMMVDRPSAHQVPEHLELLAIICDAFLVQ